jgi:hypothetical protein
MLSTFSTPLRTALFALGGAALAWLWYDVNKALPVVIVLLILVLVGGLQSYASRCVTTQPMRALRLMETRVLGIGVASAAGAALVIIVGVELVAGKGVDSSLKAIVTAATAALSAFITGMTISGEDVDGKIGDYVQSQFQARFTMEGQKDGAGRVALPKGSDALYSVFTFHEHGWTDWSKSTREKRVTVLDAYVNSLQKKQTGNTGSG